MARAYRLKQRAERQNETRQRIVEAAVELHTTLGPAHTTILAVAEQAGVERPTVYRHFPTADDLFAACSAHHWELYPAPDPEPWLQVEAAEARMRKGLSELYTYFTEREAALWVILRDAEDMPEIRRFGERMVRRRERTIDVLLSAWPDPRPAKLCAAIGHATDFFAWRSLRRQGLSNDTVAEMMIALANGVT